MSKRLRILSLVFLLTVLGGYGAQVSAQQPYRASDRDVRELLRSIDMHATTFKSSLKRGLDRSSYNHTRTEGDINRYVREFDNATNRLRGEYSGRNTATGAVEEVLSRGWAIDNFMRNNRLESYAENDWRTVRADLRRLADLYNVSWRWEDPSYNPYPVSALPDTRNEFPRDD